MDLQSAQNLLDKQLSFVHQCKYKNPQFIFKTNHGHIHTIFLCDGNRYGFLHVPDKTQCPMCTNINNLDFKEYKGLLLIYHGSRDLAFEYIFQNSELLLQELSKQNYLLFFGQSNGVMNSNVTIHPKYNSFTYGELYWGIKLSQNMNEDIQYTKEVCNLFDSLPKIFFGHSNGGVFSLLLSVHMPNTFQAIISHQGGLGYDGGFYLDFDLLKESDHKTNILFYTGTKDVHKEACEGAYNLFKNMEFPCQLIIAKNEYHGILTNDCQQALLNFILHFIYKSHIS